MIKLGKGKKNKNQEKVQPFDPNATSKGPEEFQSDTDESKDQKLIKRISSKIISDLKKE